MAELAREISPVNIEDELKQSYLDYAMSVIVGRALPDVRDGLKPVHRRVLFAMHELGNDWNKAYKKSARVVGDVIGKYHPHGDSAVYDALVRMAQDFSLRYPLIDGQGNFGSIDGDPPAAMRYTEVRMAKIAHNLLADLDKDTVDFSPNYDETEFQPSVLPAQVPNLIINGGSGIAVGMATNIPPHNLSEVIDACLALIENPNLAVEDLLQYIPGPDFPTAAIISGKAGIVSAYKTGRGRIYVRARASVEVDDKTGREAIIVHELPYQVNKARLIEKIAELVRHKKLEGISALRDESDKEGMRIVIEIKRSDSGEVVLNNLYSQTQLQTVFGINLVALVDNQPRVLNLLQILQYFILHRRQVLTRRTRYELRKARERAHVLEGLSVALANLDPIIILIKTANNPQIAKTGLMEGSWAAPIVLELLSATGAQNARPEGLDKLFGFQQNDLYKLSATQAQAILDLRLHKLTGLEQEKINHEFRQIIDKISGYLEILNNPQKLMSLIYEELKNIKEEFGDKRKTEITSAAHDLSVEDLITEEDMVVTLSNTGYAKSQPLSQYASQRRGGKGRSATKVKDEDFVSKLVIASTHDTLLCFSSLGKVYWIKVHQIPIASRISRGRPLINLLPLSPEEKINAMLPMREYSENKFIFMATSDGTVKKTSLSDFARPRSTGIIAIDLVEGNELVGAALADESDEIMLTSTSGKAIRFLCKDVRPMGRSARGVRGIKLQPKQQVISLIIVEASGCILTCTENGYGKRTKIDEFSTIGRGGQGVIAIQTTERNGRVIGAQQVADNDEIMLISSKGVLVRTRVDEISIVGRNTQGVRLINLGADEKLVGIQAIDELEEEKVLLDEQAKTCALVQDEADNLANLNELDSSIDMDDV